MRLIDLFRSNIVVEGPDAPHDDYTNKWNNLVMDYLISLKNSNHNSVDIKEIQKLLASNDYDIPSKFISMFLNDQKELVSQIDGNNVILKLKDAPVKSPHSQDKDKNKVKDLAKKNIKKDQQDGVFNNVPELK